MTADGRPSITPLAVPVSARPPKPPAGPDYYERLDPQPTEAIEAWGLPWHLGDAVAYIARAGHKPGNTKVRDLRAAIWHLEREVQLAEKEGP